MADPTVIVQGFVNPVGLRVQADTNQVIVAQRNGRLFAVDLTTMDRSIIGGAPGRINAFDVTPDGQTAYVAGDLIGVWSVGLNGRPRRRLVRGLPNSMGVLIDSDGMVLVAEGRSPGRLVSINPEPISAVVKARGLRNARGIMQEQLTGRVLAVEAGNGGRVVAPVPVGAPTVLVGGLGTPVDIAPFSNERVIVCDKAGKRVLLVDLSLPGNPPAELFTNIDNLWAAEPLGTDRLIIGVGDALLLGELVIERHEPVELRLPENELFIGGWIRVRVIINDPAIAFDDLEFNIKPREAAAMVSLSRDNSFDPTKPEIVLTAGWKPGKHELFVRHRPTGNAVGQTTFEVLETWQDQKLGPSIATFGSIESGPSGGTWGGPDSGDFHVPQNVSVTPALGTRNVGVVLVDTASARYPTGAALNIIINNLRNEMVNGVAINGQNRSVATYFNQASNGLFNLKLVGIVGPIMLPNNWNSYFFFDDPDGDGNGTWVANADLPATVIAQIVQLNVNNANAGNPPALDLSQMDSLIYVVRSRVSPPDADLFVWPRASLQTETQIIGTIKIPTPFGTLEVPASRGIARIFMPDDWATRSGGRQFHETVAHEMGHNLGLSDQYNQDGFTADATSRIADFNPNQSWELMSWERDLPLPSAAHRLMLGWVDPNRVRLYNFGVFGPIDETINLHAASLGAAPVGRFAAAEVRLEDGKNYYFEYRPSTAGRIVDPNPPEANAVLGTEAEFRSSMTADHPNILRVEEDADAVVDLGAFQTGEDFRDQDTTTPGFTNDFIVDVVNTTASEATVRVRYAPDVKPDPALTPWSPSSNWQSPDIEVINGRSLSDSAFRNIPWEGHDNTVVARVTNRGSSAARSVKVQFFWKDFTFGSGTEQPLGEQTQDIPVGASVTYTAPQLWRPPTLSFPFGSVRFKQHACLVARIDPFLDPVSHILEVTPENNEAQSNYTWMATTSSSPATREVTTILAENPFDKPAVVYFTIHQPHPLFRTYLDHRWVHLKPGEKRRILLMVESLLGDERFERVVREFQHQERRIATTLRLSALGDTHETCAAQVIGGISVLAITGIGTQFEEFEADGGSARGFVVRTDTRQGINGTVLITITPRRPDDERTEIVREGQTINGKFRVEIGSPQEVIIQAHYLGQFPLGPSESKVERL